MFGKMFWKTWCQAAPKYFGFDLIVCLIPSTENHSYLTLANV